MVVEIQSDSIVSLTSNNNNQTYTFVHIKLRLYIKSYVIFQRQLKKHIPINPSTNLNYSQINIWAIKQHALCLSSRESFLQLICGSELERCTHVCSVETLHYEGRT